MEIERCALAGFRVPCYGPIQRGHIISFTMARGNPEVRAILLDPPPELVVPLCEGHNVGRWSETKEGRRKLLLVNCERFGYQRVQKRVNGLPWKVAKPEWALEAMLR